jgi:hypothetical protein
MQVVTGGLHPGDRVISNGLEAVNSGARVTIDKSVNGTQTDAGPTDMARYFIDRPIFAWVIALIIMLVGAIATISLPIAQYPNIAPPPITVAVVYPGASADRARYRDPADRTADVRSRRPRPHPPMPRRTVRRRSS